MSTFLGSLWWLLVALGVLVTFHEFGHFWVARRCGVKRDRTALNTGMLPSGSITKNSVAAAAAMSDQFM